MPSSLLLAAIVAPVVSQRGTNPAAIIRAYSKMRLHPDIFEYEGWKKSINPALIEALDLYSVSQGRNTTALRSLLREETEGVYSFEMLSPAFCDLFLEEVHTIRFPTPKSTAPSWTFVRCAQLDNYYASGLPIARPNSMNNYGEAAVCTRCKSGGPRLPPSDAQASL